MQDITSGVTSLVHQTACSNGTPPNHHQLVFNHQEPEHSQSVENISPLQILPLLGKKLMSK